MNQLEQIKKFTIISLDTSDINKIKKYKPQDVTTNPTLILKSSIMPEYQHLLDQSLYYAHKKNGSRLLMINNAIDKLIIIFGKKILNIIPGLISTEIDAQCSFNTEMCIRAANKLIDMYEEEEVDTSRVLIKIPATWEGIKAAKILEKQGIKCNLTLIFSFAQARVCAESKVFLISPFVGRIFDWYQQNRIIKEYDVNKDPGIQSVYKIYEYYKQHQYSTIIMGASFRKHEQILALVGCDRLTISPELLEHFLKNNEPITQKLLPVNEKYYKPALLSESEFRWEHNQNEMAVNKLSEGIRRFSEDQNKLKLIINKKL